MESLRCLYQTGIGPSSSHTMAPAKIAQFLRAKYPDADRFAITLYGSLAKTGKGHGTDVALRKTLGDRTEIRFDPTATDIPHPNTMDVEIFAGATRIARHRAVSPGGGAFRIEGDSRSEPEDAYSLSTFEGIKARCAASGMRICDYAFATEPDIREYLAEIWQCMTDAIRRGLDADGLLPGGLGVRRKAKYLYRQRRADESPETRQNRMVCSYAFAVAEENAAGGKIVTAPTCGASGVVPAAFYYVKQTRGASDSDILNGLATAGLIGNLIKTNASISGAECGCQAEIGSACAMAAGGLAEIFGLSSDQIEYAAEISLEHHLGLTCDPVMGLVQIPCIERNAVAAMCALNSVSLANFLSSTRTVSLDAIIRTMYETGKDICSRYKETGEGGMAWLCSPPASDPRNS